MVPGSTEALRPGSDAGHELMDHPSEVTVRLYATTFPGLVAEATTAFGELVPLALQKGDDCNWRDFHVQASDRVARLVGWLNEIVYLCEAEQWLPVKVEAVEHDTGLRVRARGMALDAPFVLVKAATLHDAFIREGPRGLKAEVTLDI